MSRPNGATWGAWAAIRPRVALYPVLGGLLLAALLLNVGMGAVQSAPDQVVAILLDRLGIHAGIDFTVQQENVLWSIRLPRVALAMIVGAGLAMSGAALQGIFRNPLADPGLIGVSSGAAVGAIALIILGTAPLGWASQPLAAFAGALAMTLAVYVLSRNGGRTEVVTLILTGVAMNAIAGSAIGLMNFVATDAQLRNIVFWTMGGLGGATWDVVLPVGLFSCLGMVGLWRHARALNLLVLGEREAYHLGVSTERVRLRVIAFATLVAGCAVAASGIVGFVGLVVPHLLRLIAGPDHRTLLPASALGGATLVLGADLVARTVVMPAELPLGIVTALAGGPYFLWLLRRTRAAQGGWA
ncbi:MAG: FecCD family ABC transporter permease [Dehalococcoidia bacterium]